MRQIASLFIAFLLLIPNFISSTPTIENRAFLGINSNTISVTKAEKLGFKNIYGSYVTNVIENSAAHKSGLQPFDYIYGINEDHTSKFQDITRLLSLYHAGDEAEIHLVRKGKLKTVQVTFSSHVESCSQSMTDKEKAFFGVSPIGDNSNYSKDGVQVSISHNSTASAMGLEDYDMIASINDYTILDWNDLTTAIQMMQVGDPIAVEYIRSGNRIKGTSNIKSYYETKTNYKHNHEQEDEHSYYDEDREAIESPSIKPDISNMEYAITGLSGEEAEQMDFSDSNNLNVQSLILSANAEEDYFHLSFNLPASGHTYVRVLNENNNEIYSYEMEEFSGIFKDAINIGNYGIGNYYLQIRQNGKTFSKKIMLN